MSIVMVRYVGLDVHKRVVEVCIVDQSGNVVHRERFALNRRTLESFATQILQPTDHVAFEATTNCWAVADALRPHVAKLVVSNPWPPRPSPRPKSRPTKSTPTCWRSSSAATSSRRSGSPTRPPAGSAK